MADKLAIEEPLRRVMDANIRYYGALGEIAQDYWKTVFGVVRDLPIRFGTRSAAAPSTAASNPSVRATTAAALVLEGIAGDEAQGVFMVENHLSRMVSTAVVISAFSDPGGRTFRPAMRVAPNVVSLPPEGRTRVQIIATIPDDFEPDVAYRGEVTVPGLSEHGIPVLLRRTPTAETAKRSGGTAPSAKPAANKQRGGSKRRTRGR
ncbi:MAG: hypothetical protein ACTHM4_14140 [Rhodanobacteraceae bacterium]|jgi:hypothetical protein